VIWFASDFAKERAISSNELQWAEKFAQLEAESSQSVFIDETLFSAEEVKFWANSLFDCAQAIFDRKIGNQENQDWQTSTIWAMYDLARMFYREYDRRVPLFPENIRPVPEWKAAIRKRYHRLRRKLSRTLQELDEVIEKM
jgi:hypothetical protein